MEEKYFDKCAGAEKTFKEMEEKARVRSLKTNLVFTNTVGKKTGISWVMKNFIIARGKVGLEDFHFHDLRHTFATRLAQRGADLYTILKLTGHVNITMTQRYAHHCPESLRAGMVFVDPYTMLCV